MKKVLVILVAFCLVGISQAALTSYSQDFEGLTQADPAALTNDGWLVFGNVFDSGGGYLYGYGPFAAPNGGPAFSAVAAGEGGVPQGAQQLVAYSDYNNGDHGAGNLIEANVFQEQVIGAGDAGIWTFSFDAKHGDLASPSTALAFIKTLDPDAGWATTNFLTVDMTSIPATWGSHSIDIDVTGLSGQILQIGFSSTASNYVASGTLYDNVEFVPEPTTMALLGLGGLLLRRRKKA